MSSILKISPLNVLHFTALSTKSPDVMFYMCRQCRDNQSVIPRERRFYSTYESPLSSTTRKKLKKSSLKNLKKFAELVKVSDNKITQKKVRIGKLTACHVEAFAEQPGMTLKISNKQSNKKFQLIKDYNKKINEFQAKLNDYKSTVCNRIESSHENKVPNTENSKSHINICGTNKLETSSNIKQTSDINYDCEWQTFKTSLNEQFNKIIDLGDNYFSSSARKNSAKVIRIKDEKEYKNESIGEVGNSFAKSPPKDMSYSKLKKLKQDKRNHLMPLNIDYIKKNEQEGDSYWGNITNEVTTKDEDHFSNYNEIFGKKIVDDASQKDDLSSCKSSIASFKGAEVLEFEEGKKYNFKEFLDSYVDVCINSNMIDTAYEKIKSEKRYSHFWQNVQVYNRLLHGYSRLGNWTRVQEILNFMKQREIKLDSQSYAAIFDCLGNITSEKGSSYVKNHIEMYLEKLISQGNHLDDLFHKTKLINNQREIILKVIRTIYPDYEIPKRTIELNSDCELLAPLEKICEPYKTQATEEITLEMLHKLIEEQLEVENNFVVKVKSVIEPKSDIEEKTQRLFDEWRSTLHEAFIRSVKMINYENDLSSIKTLTPFLNCLPAETFVDCMLHELRRVVTDFNEPPVYLSSMLLGTRVWQSYVFKKKKNTGELDKLIQLYKKWAEWYLIGHGPATNGRQYWQMLLNDYSEGPNVDLNADRWPPNLRRQIGDFLYKIMINECRFNVNIKREIKMKPRLVPVFYPKLVHEKQKQIGYLKFHPTMQKLFQAYHCKTLMFDPDQIPMVSPAKPWSHVNSGGFIIRDTLYMRPIKGLKAKTMPYDRIPQKQLYPSFDALNQLQSVPWKVNEDMLEVALSVFKLGGSEELEVPSLPDMKLKRLVFPKDSSDEMKIKLKSEHKKMIKETLNKYGLWCEALYKLSLANHFRKRVIWLPQNMDFRGRVYPVPPHFNHLSADLYRSLLMFAKGRSLGPNGLDWLKIHTINLTGTHKKKTVKERLKYANEILDKIVDSAEHPLTGEMWWKKSDEPWQTLAACMEIKKALQCPNPKNYVSHFPVHQDGSCNGLQHYAALGRDVIGANSVNVSPSDTPQDVYSCVLAIVEEKRKADAAKGDKIAKILEGFVERKVIKQTVMTTVYGVTPYGAKLQILRQLEYLKDFDQNFGITAANYLSQKVFESLNEMFTSATEIQEWFVECAKVISKDGGDYVKWITPLGLPVVQPYAKQQKIELETGGKAKIITTPNILKQKNAFPPNFVHSLDSSHMMLTALHCEQKGITYAAIHDCFWTHACSVEIMNKICREQFAALHSQPILEDLSEQFREYYLDIPPGKRKIFENVPRTGNLDLTSVLDSVYFFS